MSNFASLLSSVGGSKPGNQPGISRIPPVKPRETTAQPALPSQSTSTLLKRKREDEPASKSTPSRTSSPVTASSRPLPTNGPPPQTSQKQTQGQASAQARPPPKGSYREVLLRAQAAKDAVHTLGQIKHKSVVKPVKRRSASPEKGKSSLKKVSTTAVDNARRPGVPSPVQKGPNNLARPRKQPVDLGYKGTMRAKDVPVAKQRAPAAAEAPGRTAQRPPKARHHEEYDEHLGKSYRYASDSDDAATYSGDDDDDLDGGGFDELMAEEEASLRAARHEDLEAERAEDAHRREKAAKKRALEALAARRAGRG